MHKKNKLQGNGNQLLFWQLGKLSFYIESVRNDVKPIAHISVFDLCLLDCLEDISRAKLQHIMHCKDKDTTDIYIYRYDHLKHVINRSIGKPHSEKIFSEWVNGKMFGYSENKINKYIKENA